ncbi:MAG: FHA domain-containing protein [Nocardiaceae bacterium]|nr:FHA domain-containing protein [Nocardiaceae bacterium]
MGIVDRFERKLQGAVGDAFARVFRGAVLPQEVEAALKQEASGNVQTLEGGHKLAPNSYVITVNSSDHERLANDRALTVRAFSRHLEDYIREQGWQTYGDIQVTFEASEVLHTGQFRTSGLVDPDVVNPDARSRASAPPPPPSSGARSMPSTETSQAAAATLFLEDGSHRAYRLKDGVNVVGRGQDADFRLPDTGVSRRHFEVHWDGSTAVLRDLGSTNGTLVNGHPVREWQLANNDVIRAGNSEIHVQFG